MDTDTFEIERFKNVTTMIRYHNDKMIEAFNRFISFVIAIIGGAYTLLSFEHLEKTVKFQVVALIPCLLGLVAIGSLTLIFSNYKSWYGFRKAESSLSGGVIPSPTPLSMSEQLLMAVFILAIWVGYYCLNPFAS